MKGWGGLVTTQKAEVLNTFFTAIFTEKNLPSAIPGPQEALKVWHKENLSLVKEDQVTFAILWV